MDVVTLMYRVGSGRVWCITANTKKKSKEMHVDRENKRTKEERSQARHKKTNTTGTSEETHKQHTDLALC